MDFFRSEEEVRVALLSFTQNHFTSLYIPSNNFIEEALSHCSCVQAFVGIHVWSCRHL